MVSLYSLDGNGKNKRNGGGGGGQSLGGFVIHIPGQQSGSGHELDMVGIRYLSSFTPKLVLMLYCTFAIIRDNTPLLLPKSSPGSFYP